MEKANAQKNTLLKSAQANAESIFFKRVFFSPTQEKNLPTLLFLIQLFSQRTGLVRNRTDNASKVNRFVESVVPNPTRHIFGQTAAHAGNKGLPKAGVTSFYDSFVLNRTLVFQMNGSAEKPRLR